MKSWYKNWDVISPIFKFSADVRKVIYTTNAIESLNSGYRRLNKQRSVFPSDTALLKALPRDYKEVDDAVEKLGQSSWQAGGHVPRQTELSRHGQSAEMERSGMKAD